jgi:hypothetical protein
MDKMDTEHQDQRYYNVEIFGDYFTSTSMGNVVKPYGPIVLKMRDWTSCQMLARKHVLPTLLKDADPEFKDIRRCIVYGVKTMDNNPVHGLPIRFMSREQIIMEASDNNILLKAEIYPDIIELRKKLYLARTNPEKFKEQEKQNIRAFDRIGDALGLNANVFDDIKSSPKQGNISLSMAPKNTQETVEVKIDDDAVEDFGL